MVMMMIFPFILSHVYAPGRCLIGTAPRYLAADCVPVSEKAQRRHQRSVVARWPSARRAVVPSELVWPLGVFCTRSETVELSA